MTDMRATERLLEVIEDRADHALNRSMDAIYNGDESHSDVTEILAAARELRSRGDTLVRRDDLRLLVEGKLEILPEPRPGDVWSDTDERSRAYFDAITRLENAIGGKP